MVREAIFAMIRATFTCETCYLRYGHGRPWYGLDIMYFSKNPSALLSCCDECPDANLFPWTSW